MLACGVLGLSGLLAAGGGWLLFSGGSISPPVPSPSPSPQPPSVIPPSSPRILLVIPPRDVWYPDYGPLKSRLEQWGARVEVASSESGPSSSLVGAGVPGPDIRPDLPLRETRGQDYDAVAFVGYAVGDYLPGNVPGREVRRLIEQALERPRPTVGSICAANAVLSRHGFLSNRKAAGNRWANELGAQPGEARWEDHPLVIDGPFLTARSDRDVVAFARALFERAAAGTPQLP
jgi:putative intracellular protease/amidase